MDSLLAPLSSAALVAWSSLRILPMGRLLRHSLQDHICRALHGIEFLCPTGDLSNHHLCMLAVFHSPSNTTARRILFIVNALTLPMMPNVVFFPITSLNPSLSRSYYMYRIQWIGPAMAIVLTSVGLVFMTPKIKQILGQQRNTERRRVGPTGTTLQLVSI